VDSSPLLKTVTIESRLHHGQSITVPGTDRLGSGFPPISPARNAFMSIDIVPVQSSAGGSLPSANDSGVRCNGGENERGNDA